MAPSFTQLNIHGQNEWVSSTVKSWGYKCMAQLLSVSPIHSFVTMNIYCNVQRHRCAQERISALEQTSFLHHLWAHFTRHIRGTSCMSAPREVDEWTPDLALAEQKTQPTQGCTMAWFSVRTMRPYLMVPQKLGERQVIGKFATRPSQRNAQRRRGYEGGRTLSTQGEKLLTIAPKGRTGEWGGDESDI